MWQAWRRMARMAFTAACLGATAQAALAQAPAVPTISCTSDPHIFNTAYDPSNGGLLAEDATNAYWQAAQGPFQGSGVITLPPANATPFGPTYVGQSSQWTNPPATLAAKWIYLLGLHSGYGTIDLWYRFQFNLDPSVDPANFSLGMDMTADNAVAEVFVNGVAQSTKTTGLPQNSAANPANGGTYYNPYGYQGFWGGNMWRRIQPTLNHDWQPGLNTIIVQIKSGIPLEGFFAAIRPDTPLCVPKPAVEVSKTTTATRSTPGAQVPYTVTVKNVGSVAAGGTVLTDPLPAGVESMAWTCTATGGAACPNASGSGAIHETVATLPAGDSVVYQVVATLASGTPVAVTNVATLTPPVGGSCQRAGVADPTCSATVVLPPVAVVGIAKSASVATVAPGGKVTYTVTVANESSGDATSVAVSDPLAQGIDSTTWTCATGHGSALCPAASGAGALQQTIATLPAGSSLVYTIQATVGANAPSEIVNTASLTLSDGSLCGPTCSAQATVKRQNVVEGTVAPVPTLAQWALAALALLMAAVAAHRMGRH